VIARAKERIGNVYGLRCSSCSREATLAKTVWTIRVACTNCGEPVNYYRALEAADWQKPDMACQACGEKVPRRSPRIDEQPVLDSISCTCSPRQIEQAVTAAPELDLDGMPYPLVQITPDRQMYKIQGLGKSGLTSIASFYSRRNLAVVTALHQEINSLDDIAVREKLLFAFTACLARASKRYQWSHQGPLNAANAYYYISPVFYEWNVYDLFRRKIEAILKADENIRSTRQLYTGIDTATCPDVEYEISSAEQVPLEDNSADYIFTDPPFGSNLFYADMALFHEAWLGSFTEHTQEAVIDRGTGKRDEARYEGLLVSSLTECRRILKPGRHISMIFGNSSGRMWALLQRAIQDAHLNIIPEALVILNKGQRSAKGLASGFEHVATLDLVITMTPSGSPPRPLRHVSKEQIIETTRRLALSGNATTPSHLYLELLRTGIRECWKLDELDLRTVTEFLVSEGWEIEPKTGILTRIQPVPR
jgi:hypothetical protein